jgi:hypothetical protein
MPELPYTALPTPATPIGDLEIVAVGRALCQMQQEGRAGARGAWYEPVGMESGRPLALSQEDGWRDLWRNSSPRRAGGMWYLWENDEDHPRSRSQG